LDDNREEVDANGRKDASSASARGGGDATKGAVGRTVLGILREREGGGWLTSVSAAVLPERILR
jgi:hypothetical protein